MSLQDINQQQREDRGLLDREDISRLHGLDRLVTPDELLHLQDISVLELQQTLELENLPVGVSPDLSDKIQDKLQAVKDIENNIEDIITDKFLTPNQSTAIYNLQSLEPDTLKQLVRDVFHKEPLKIEGFLRQLERNEEAVCEILYKALTGHTITLPDGTQRFVRAIDDPDIAMRVARTLLNDPLLDRAGFQDIKEGLSYNLDSLREGLKDLRELYLRVELHQYRETVYPSSPPREAEFISAGGPWADPIAIGTFTELKPLEWRLKLSRYAPKKDSGIDNDRSVLQLERRIDILSEFKSALLGQIMVTANPEARRELGSRADLLAEQIAALESLAKSYAQTDNVRAA